MLQSCLFRLVAPTGEVVRSAAIARGTEFRCVLKRPVKKLIPAIHNHQPVIAVFMARQRSRRMANRDSASFLISNQRRRGNISSIHKLVTPRLKITNTLSTGTTVRLTGVVELAPERYAEI